MTTRAVGIRRLLKLAGILDTADAEHRKKKEPVYNQMSMDHLCGTPACALGHWAFNNPRRWRYERIALPAVSWMDSKVPEFYVEVCLKARQSGSAWRLSFSEAANDFGITDMQADELFSGEGCGNARTAKQAARYIRKFVKRLQKEAA